MECEAQTAFSPLRTRFGRERHAGGSRIPWHPHGIPYAAVVLRGGYWEAGDKGRHRVEAGDVLLHERFDGHANSFGRAPSEVLNLPLADGEIGFAQGKAADPDRLARVAERDLLEASRLLSEMLVRARHVPVEDWPDRLAAALCSDPILEIGAWARRHGLAPATVSRGFRAALGVSPLVYRRRQRARRAWQLITRSAEPLAQIAAHQGFFDQAHMTREIAWLTGRTPGMWRAKRSNPYNPA
jgi:AraC-like DNA-binding protein